MANFAKAVTLPRVSFRAMVLMVLASEGKTLKLIVFFPDFVIFFLRAFFLETFFFVAMRGAYLLEAFSVKLSFSILRSFKKNFRGKHARAFVESPRVTSTGMPPSMGSIWIS